MIWDHVLAATFALGFPLLTTPVYLRRKPALLAGDSRVRIREYRETIVWLSSMGVVTLVLWVLTGRSLDQLGLGSGVGFGWRSAAAAAIALAGVTLLRVQTRFIRRDPATREAARETLYEERDFLPATRRELRWFRGVSVAAGVGEELFYRGFLLAYLTVWMPLLWAVVVSSVLFGFAHVMHGARATARSTVAGIVLAGLFVLSGSLWASMLLHTVIDWAGGDSGYAVFSTD